MNKCVICGGTIEGKKVTFVFEEKDKQLFVENVSAEVCTRCGERTYSPEVTDEIMAIAKHKFQPVKIVSVPVFDYERGVAV
ncbi:MAG: YgiT-type zinc finger protein [Ignavibacteriae bacterium]|nr:YgiT-type zinc finger protein [Ignavibacteriota bacterium]